MGAQPEVRRRSHGDPPQDFVRLRTRRACRYAEEAGAWLTFVIVGAGATGLELSGALAEIARETLRHDFRKIDPQKARIILMEGAPRVLGPFPEDLSAKAEKLVSRLGVEVLKRVMVKIGRAHV